MIGNASQRSLQTVARFTMATLVLSLLSVFPDVASAQRSLSPMETLVAPIALYPDPLVAQLLPAATYPDQIAAAAAYVAKNGATGVENQGWDASVAAIAHYKGAIDLLGSDPQWTNELGNAFLDQTSAVLDAIQQLRARALASGALKDTPEHLVILEDEMIRIVPAQAETIYVPQYDPEVIYVESEDGDWDDAYWDSVFGFGVGYAMGAWMSMDCDWWGHCMYFHGWNGWGGGGHYWQNRHYVDHHRRNINGGGGNRVWNNPRRPGGSGNRNRPGGGGGNRPSTLPSRPGGSDVGDRARPSTLPSTKRDQDLQKKREKAQREARGKMPETSDRAKSGDRGALDKYERGSDAKKSSDRGSRSRTESSFGGGGGRSRPSGGFGGGGRRGGGGGRRR